MNRIDCTPIIFLELSIYNYFPMRFYIFSKMKFLRCSGVFRSVAVNRRVRPNMPPHVRREPEAVEADRNEFEQCAAKHQPAEIRTPIEEADAIGQRDGRNRNLIVHAATCNVQ